MCNTVTYYNTSKYKEYHNITSHIQLPTLIQVKTIIRTLYKCKAEMLTQIPEVGRIDGEPELREVYFHC